MRFAKQMAATPNAAKRNTNSIYAVRRRKNLRIASKITSKVIINWFLEAVVVLRFTKQMAAMPNAAKRNTNSIYAVKYRMAVNNIRASSEINFRRLRQSFSACRMA